MFEKLKDIIEQNDSIVIFGHIHPDGDCYGSQIGLREAIRLNYPNKKVYAVGTGCHRFFNYIGAMDIVSDEIVKNSLAILVDANDFSRVEDHRIEIAKEHIKIDHHVENGWFTQGPYVVDEQANSAAQLVAELIIESKWKVNQKVTNPLYLGILTDTGRFQFIEDFPRAFKEASWLVENGADPKAINDILNITAENSMRFKGYVFSHYKKSKNGVIYLTLNKNQLHKFKISASKAGSMVNLLSNIDGYPIWGFFCENEDGTDHIELRSNGPLVQPIAASVGGGGHNLAAGATVKEFDEESIQSIIDKCDAAIIEYKKEQK